ncbi:MAG: hypothetical protein PHQ56_04335 [Dysgonamonadaceae bacterium]|nr:hypothetical protein [Dysgonamonadaceae bacterium]
MIYKFLLSSDEVANYRREIQIDADATFFDLHKIIMKCNDFEEVEMTSFFICNDWWRKKEEISLIEIETDSDVDSFVMEEEILSDWLEEEQQKLIFVFDYSKERGLFMELSEIILGETLATAKCAKKQGNAPSQFIKEVEEVPKPVSTTSLPIDTDDEFYGDEEYDPEELDIEGFEGLDEPENDLELPESTELF